MTNELTHYDYIDPLTNRELEVLQLLAQGLSNKDIADQLFLEITTVKWFNSQIYSKLQVKNRKQAVVRAQTLGILESSSADPLLRVLHNLPADTLPFIGREKEIQTIISELSDNNKRLVTILGVGGMGKTHLATELGRRLLPRFLQGVYFIALASIDSAELIITTIAEAIDFKFHGSETTKHQLLNYLRDQQMLLIIDNFEHLLDSAHLLNDILKAAPNIKLLVTSREKLNLSGEVQYRIRGLSIPFEEAPKHAVDYDGFKLFAEACQRRNVQINQADIDTVVEICQVVGGMPLAILLAAAWIDTLSLSEILAEIRAGLDILEATIRDMPERHQSIEMVFDYSWKRLSEKEQDVFMKLSVFKDGFTREAAKAVADAGIHDLQRLVHTSFIERTASERYAVHELMRQFGEQKLKASGVFDAIREQHAQFFAKILNPVEPTWGVDVSDETMEKIHNDFNNVRAAWLYETDKLNIAELNRFLDGLWVYLDLYSRSQEGIEIFEPLLQVLQTREDRDGKLFYGRLLARYAWLNNDLGEVQTATNLAHEAHKILQSFSATTDLLFVYSSLFWAYRFAGNNTASLSYAQQGLDLAETAASPEWKVTFSIMVGDAYMEFGRYDEALELIESQPDCRFKLFVLPFLLMKMGNYVRAEAVLLEGLEKYRDHRIGYMFKCGGLAECAWQRQDYDKALDYIVKGLQYVDMPGYRWAVMDILVYRVKSLIAADKLIEATTLVSMIANHPATVEGTRGDVMNLKAILSERLADDAFQSAWERGEPLDLDDVISDLMER